jgi:hypothetical protein
LLSLEVVNQLQVNVVRRTLTTWNCPCIGNAPLQGFMCQPDVPFIAAMTQLTALELNSCLAKDEYVLPIINNITSMQNNRSAV